MRRVVGVLFVAVLLSGCGQGLLFRQDHRITVLTPDLYSTIREPIDISWSTPGFSAGRDGSYEVFVDRSPMPPGESIDYFDQRDRQGIFTTDKNAIHFDIMSPVDGASSAERNYHEVTVILLDPDGNRIGEEAGFVAFHVLRNR